MGLNSQQNRPFEGVEESKLQRGLSVLKDLLPDFSTIQKNFREQARHALLGAFALALASCEVGGPEGYQSPDESSKSASESAGLISKNPKQSNSPVNRYFLPVIDGDYSKFHIGGKYENPNFKSGNFEVEFRTYADGNLIDTCATQGGKFTCSGHLPEETTNLDFTATMLEFDNEGVISQATDLVIDTEAYGENGLYGKSHMPVRRLPDPATEK